MYHLFECYAWLCERGSPLLFLSGVHPTVPRVLSELISPLFLTYVYLI